MRKDFKSLVKSDGLKAPSARSDSFDLPAEEKGESEKIRWSFYMMSVDRQLDWIDCISDSLCGTRWPSHSADCVGRLPSWYQTVWNTHVLDAFFNFSLDFLGGFFFFFAGREPRVFTPCDQALRQLRHKHSLDMHERKLLPGWCAKTSVVPSSEFTTSVLTVVKSTPCVGPVGIRQRSAVCYCCRRAGFNCVDCWMFVKDSPSPCW